MKKLLGLTGVMAVAGLVFGGSAAQANKISKFFEKNISCHVKVKVNNKCGRKIEINSVNLWHKRDLGNKMPIPVIGDPLKGGSSKTYDYHMLVPCDAKKKAEVCFMITGFQGQSGSTYSNWRKGCDDNKGGWVSGKTLEIDVKTCSPQ